MSTLPSLLTLPADGAPTAVLDFETTGLDPSEGHRVVEVAVLRVQDGVEQHFTTLVDPARAIPPLAQSIHGISDAMVADQPSLAQVAPRILELLQDAVIVAHNAPFDLGFLANELSLAGLPAADLGPSVCTLSMARNLFGLPRCNLTALAARVGVPFDNPHRAMPDVRATFAVYQAMLRSLAVDADLTVGWLLDEIRALRKGGPGRQRITARVKQAAAEGVPLTMDYTARLRDPEREPTSLVTRRTITITGLRMPYIEAFCHLRDEERVFRVDRIRQIIEE